MSAEFSQMRDFEAWQKSLKDFSWLQGSVPGASDLDLIIERKGQFLIIETKAYQPGVGVRVPFGQHLMLEVLAKEQNKKVWLVGDPGDGETFYWLELGTKRPTKVRTAPVWWKPRQFLRVSKAGLAEMAKGWFDEASQAA